MPSFILKDAEEYSYSWHIVNIAPSEMVITKAFITSKRAFFEPEIIKALWAHVILIPEDNKITVFNSGKPHGFKTSIPTGGQTHPNAVEGIRLE